MSIIILTPMRPSPTRPDPLPIPPPELVLACPHTEAWYDEDQNLICAACFAVLAEGA
jgi:hypothetical protein